jgi:hypothetical protein
VKNPDEKELVAVAVKKSTTLTDLIAQFSEQGRAGDVATVAVKQSDREHRPPADRGSPVPTDATRHPAREVPFTR